MACNSPLGLCCHDIDATSARCIYFDLLYLSTSLSTHLSVHLWHSGSGATAFNSCATRARTRAHAPMAAKRLFQQAVAPLQSMAPGSASPMDYGRSRKLRQRFKYGSDSTAAFVDLSPLHTPSPEDMFQRLQRVPGVAKVPTPLLHRWGRFGRSRSTRLAGGVLVPIDSIPIPMVDPDRLDPDSDRLEFPARIRSRSQSAPIQTDST